MRIRYGCALIVALLTLAGCGATGGGAEPSPTTMSDAQVLAIGKQIAQCIRDQGIVEFPDPIVDEHGQLQLPGNAEGEIEGRYPQATLQQAQAACQSLFEQLPESAVKGGPDSSDPNAPGPEDVEALKAWAKCARENGIPEWPDPKADGSFPVRGTPLEREGKSDRLRAVFDACQQYWDGGITFS